MDWCESERKTNKFIKRIGGSTIQQMGAPLNLYFVVTPKDDGTDKATCSFFNELDKAVNYAKSLLKPEEVVEQWWQK